MRKIILNLLAWLLLFAMLASLLSLAIAGLGLGCRIVAWLFLQGWTTF